jgi:opacity protein-like surface antigen
MTRHLTAAALVAAALAALPAAAAAREVRQLTVVEHATTDVTIDVGAAGDSTGDLLTFHNRVYDRRDRHVVGRDQGRCVRIDPTAGSWECAWVVQLRHGQLTVEGPFYDKRDSTMAVTGGTGRYRGARGEMRLQSRAGGSKYAFGFRLLR